MSKKNRLLVPVKNCCVRKPAPGGIDVFGRVVGHSDCAEKHSIMVKWEGMKYPVLEEVINIKSGFKVNMDVQDVPNSRSRTTLGEGVVLRLRKIGSREQVLVDFYQAGEQVWLPYENLCQIIGARHRFLLNSVDPGDYAERFRLKSLAHALEIWNENTGSLSNMEIDPLPHQINLVHHILASGSLNWLIADDVGLGKTIETGMLLAALKQRGRLKRALIIAPAGLTKQWQDELNNKFKMDDFQIYGEDFVINESRHWKMYDFVISSLDRLKIPENMSQLMQAGYWDIIIFDEAHRLSRRQYGMKLKSSQRFALAANLREFTDSMILLSATPHQGMQDKFQALLELLHPNRKREIRTLSSNPEIIGEMVFRNNKADVTDADGNFLFKGKTTRSVSINVSDDAIRFDMDLQKYIIKGYAAGKATGGVKGNAIGFVMTVYRKLAASSVAAIEQALINRRKRVKESRVAMGNEFEYDMVDQRFVGEWEEEFSTGSTEFFDGEDCALKALIEKAELLRNDDRKLKGFISEIIGKVLSENPLEKILIFTEYRTTQKYILEALRQIYGEESAEIINGSMPHSARREAIYRFEESARFLVSTEAGGEGINLQRKCHIMVNYDLPWNPMRLVQRIGRLYRYGQEKVVTVFNLNSPGTADDKIVDLMYTRISQVVDDLAGVGSEYNDRLREDIVGEVSSILNIKEILADAVTLGIERTEARINEALERAKESVNKHREIFEYASGFNPGESLGELRIDYEHSVSFIIGMFIALGIDILGDSYGGMLISIRLPEDIVKELMVNKSRYDVTVSREIATNRPNTHMMDLDSFLMKYLINRAKSYNFEGMSAVIKDKAMGDSSLITGILRWQNDQGNRLRQEYTAYLIRSDGRVEINPMVFSEWLKGEPVKGVVDILPTARENNIAFERAVAASEIRLGEISNTNLHPENNQWVSVAWVKK